MRRTANIQPLCSVSPVKILSVRSDPLVCAERERSCTVAQVDQGKASPSRASGHDTGHDRLSGLLLAGRQFFCVDYLIIYCDFGRNSGAMLKCESVPGELCEPRLACLSVPGIHSALWQTTFLLIPLNAPAPSQLEVLEQLLRSGCHLVAGRMSILDEEQRKHIAEALKGPSRGKERVRSSAW